MTHVTPPPLVFIRKATPEDTGTILRLIQALADYERLSHEVVTDEAALRRSLFADDSNAHALLAEQNGAPVAFALYFYNFSTFLGRPGLYLEDLFVLPEYRSQRIGSALLQQLAKLAKARGCGRFEWSVLDWNEPAIRFYERMGAKPMSDWTVYRLTGEALDHLAAAAAPI